VELAPEYLVFSKVWVHLLLHFFRELEELVDFERIVLILIYVPEVQDVWHACSFVLQISGDIDLLSQWVQVLEWILRSLRVHSLDSIENLIITKLC
jgi:hypothetical protein